MNWRQAYVGRGDKRLSGESLSGAYWLIMAHGAWSQLRWKGVADQIGAAVQTQLLQQALYVSAVLMLRESRAAISLLL